MKTIHKAFLFAAFAMLAAVLIVLPVDGSSADTDVQIANSGEGSTWVQISFDEEIEAPLTLTVYDSDRQQIDSVELPNVDGMTVYTFQLNERLDTASSYHMTVSSGGQTYYSDLDAAAVLPVLRYIVVVDESDNGSVEATPVFGVSGTEVSLEVSPDDGYALKTLEVSGIDVSSQVRDGVYIFDLTADTAVSATFGAGAADYSSQLRAALVDDDDGIYIMIVARDGKVIPDGEITVTYDYTYQRTVAGRTLTGSASASFAQDYASVGNAYAYTLLDFAGQAAEHYSGITGADAVFSAGASGPTATAAGIVFTLPATS